MPTPPQQTLLQHQVSEREDAAHPLAVLSGLPVRAVTTQSLMNQQLRSLGPIFWQKPTRRFF